MDVVEEPQLDQNHSSGPEVQLETSPDHVDQDKQQDRQEREEELLDVDLENKPSQHPKLEVSHSLCFKTSLGLVSTTSARQIIREFYGGSRNVTALQVSL